MKAVKLKITGVVQGVGYRYFAYRLAHRYGVKGYVMNLPDGSVEVVAEGEEPNLSRFLEEVARGPASAIVENVMREDIEPRGFGNFTIEYYRGRGWF